MKLLISQSAFEDLENILEYYNEQLITSIGEQFVASILEHLELLVEHPDIGRIVPEFDEAYIREIIHPPFRIVYLREKTNIQVIRIWRSERILELPADET